MNTALFTCPICRAPLVPEQATYRCAAGHCYDIARRGYVNLLSGKAGGQHGDNREMLEARRRFLDGGYYAPLRACLCEQALATVGERPRILDAGCGECYYTEGVTRALEADGREPETVGIDVSREALCLGARRKATAALAVASVYALPFADGCFDLLLSVFSPFAGEEFSRVLKKGGHLLMAIPRERHLFGLKEILYEHPYENRPQDTALPGFRLIEDRPVTDRITLRDRGEIEALFKMTPYYYRTSPTDREKLLGVECLETEIAFSVLLYERI